jgi:hypothetical protein
MLRFAVDTVRLRGPDGTKVDDDQFYVAPGGFSDEAGISRALGALFARITFRIDVHGGELRARFIAESGPRAPAPRKDPRDAIRDQCVGILRKAFAAAQPALAKLDLSDHSEELAETYFASLDASLAIQSCAKLPAGQRACIQSAKTPPQVAAATCVPDRSFHDSGLELPPLISFFDRDPLDARLHPLVDAKPLIAKLRGTWVRKRAFGTETWKIDAAGDVVATTVFADNKPNKTERFHLWLDHAGRLEQVEDNGTQSRRQWYPIDANTFAEGGEEAVVAPSADRFVLPDNSGYVVREPSGCWFVTREGLLVDAKCTPGKTRDVIDISYGDSYHTSVVLSQGWAVSQSLIDEPFVRKP